MNFFSAVPIRHFPPGKQEGGGVVQQNPPGTKLVVLRSTPRYVLLQLSVWLMSTSKNPKDMISFGKQEVEMYSAESHKVRDPNMPGTKN